MAKKFKISEKDYNYCVSKLREFRDIYDITRDPQIKMCVDYYETLLTDSKVADLSGLEDTHVLIGDKVTIAINDGYGEDAPETYKLSIDLVGAQGDDISLRCPLGEAIYLQKIGSVCKYKVNNNSFDVRILSKEKSLEDVSESENV